MRRLLVLVVALLLVPAAAARTSARVPVGIVAAETSNQVIAVSLGPHGGRVLKHVHVSTRSWSPHRWRSGGRSRPATGTVTLLSWHSLRPVKLFHGFRDPEVARIAPAAATRTSPTGEREI